MKTKITLDIEISDAFIKARDDVRSRYHKRKGKSEEEVKKILKNDTLEEVIARYVKNFIDKEGDNWGVVSCDVYYEEHV